jgi:hypothetical protein
LLKTKILETTERDFSVVMVSFGGRKATADREGAG